MSTTNIKLKRSSVPGKQPNTSILELGEVALNTYDGKIFIKKDDGAESIVTIQEVTEDNLAIDSSLLDNATANTLAGVLDDLDEAITTLSGGGLSQVTTDSTLTGLGTAGSPLSVVNDGHSHTVSTITNFTSSVNSAIDTRVDKTFVDALNVDANTLDDANGSFYLDYTNFVNTPSIPVSGVDFDPVGTDNSTDVTLAGSYDYLTITGQQITLNQIDATTDVSGLATVATSGSYNDLTDKPTDSDTTYDLVSPGSGVIRLSDSANSNDDITFVGSGATTVSSNATHITISSTDNDTTYSSGDGIDLTGTTFSHADTSTQASLSVLSGGAVVSDIDLDGFGHVTNLATRTLTTSDIGEGTNLYYTTARANTDIDARVTKSFVDALNVDANTLDDANGSFYLDYSNFTNTPSIPVSGVDFDPVGTDNSTDVTLAGSYDYLTITGQQITLNQIDYTTDISNLPTLYTTSDANTDIDARVTQSFVNALNVTAAGVQANSVALGADTTGNYVATISGTANEIEVTGSGSETAAVTIGLPDDVTIGNNLIVSGNLTVSGATTTVNTETINLADNIITLNSNETGTPSQNAGLEIERGTSNNVFLRWNEGSDVWETTNDGTNFYRLLTTNDEGAGNGLDADTLDGQQGSHYLDYSNFTNTPTIGDATVTVSAGSGLTTGGTFTTNQVANSTVTISHADTSTQASLTALTGGNVVSDIDLDGFGHVTGLSTRTLTTTDIDEGTNLYYTTARANTAIDNRVTQSFVNALNVTAAGVQTNSVSLGSDTTGNYVATISGTANEIEVSGSGSETAAVTIGLPDDVDIAGSITIASLYDLIGETASTTTTTQTEIASFTAATYSSGKFVIQATDSVSGEVHVTELLIVHDGTTASATEYGTIHTGSSPLATYDVDINSGNVRVLATAASTNSTTYKVTENLITA